MEIATFKITGDLKNRVELQAKFLGVPSSDLYRAGAHAILNLLSGRTVEEAQGLIGEVNVVIVEDEVCAKRSARLAQEDGKVRDDAWDELVRERRADADFNGGRK